LADGSIKPDSTHGKFTAEMCKRTVINKTCKPIINNSNDSSLLAVTARQTETDAAAAEVDADIELEANQGEPIDPPATPEEKAAEGQAKIPGVE
jgi:recombination protein RecT